MEHQLILDRYRPLELLGEGGYGEVVLAWDTRMQRRVAIKRLPLPLITGSGLVPGLAEARTAAMLNHPAIVTVHDFDTDSDEAFVIMEFVDGASLGELLEHLDGPLNDDEAAAVLRPVFDAIAFAHGNGVLHLDIKPDNVLIDREGRVKVVDFGVAALSSAAGHGPAEGGTLGFMPLEQLEGAQCTEATDIWALGALAFEALTDSNPYAATTLNEAIVRVESPQLPPSRYADVAPGVDAAVGEAMRELPTQRYEAVDELAAALLPLLGDEGVGRELLASSVAEIVGEEEEEHPERTGRGLGLWDRASRWGPALLRVLGAVEAAGLAAVGLGVAGLTALPLLGAVALVGLAGAFAPTLGVGLGWLALALGLLLARAWVAAACIVLVGLPFWWFAARHRTAAALVPPGAPLLGIVWMAPASPLIAGFALGPVAAAATGFVAAWAYIGIAALVRLGGADPWWAQISAAPVQYLPTLVSGGAAGRPMIGMVLETIARNSLTTTAVWVFAITWTLAALAMSLPSGRATKGGAALGLALSGGILCVGTVFAGLAAGLPAVPSTEWWPAVGPLALSLILMTVVVALGAPIRSEEDRPRDADDDEVSA